MNAQDEKIATAVEVGLTGPLAILARDFTVRDEQELTIAKDGTRAFRNVLKRHGLAAHESQLFKEISEAIHGGEQDAISMDDLLDYVREQQDA